MVSNIKNLFFLLISSCALLATNAYSDRLEEGQALAKAKGCFDCHGKSGNTAYVGTEGAPTPVIAEQSFEYLRKAMLDYKSGARSGTIMTDLMSLRSDEEIDLLAEYYAAQERY